MTLFGGVLFYPLQRPFLLGYYFGGGAGVDWKNVKMQKNLISKSGGN